VRRPAAQPTRFARAARDPRWSAEESARARARLARQAAHTRQRLAAQRAQAAAPRGEPPRPGALRARLATRLLLPLMAAALLALLGAALPVSSQTQAPRAAPIRQSIEEVRRLIEVAKEAGLTEEQIRQITIEDEFGNVINAWDYLQQIEQRRQAELARRKAELSRVYLTPQDILKELRANERADLDALRDKLPFDRERYR
jgi:hypothetical protein